MKWIASLAAAVLWVQASAADFDLARTARACRAGAAESVRDPRMLAAIALAREQHRLFGGQLIDRRGGIVRIGFHEAEFDRPKTESTPTWKRVAQFWAALDEDLPSTFRSRDEGMVSRKRLVERIAGLNVSGVASMDEKELAAVQSALLRSALVDHPWSAAFISYLMKTSGFDKSEFEFSDSHVDYVDQAFATSAGEIQSTRAEGVYRACDVVTTRPRAGDLICHTREGSAAVTSYAALLDQIEARHAAAKPREIPMHCDLVTRADAGGNAKLEAVGGNVFQSVTLREMALNADKRLSAKYLQGAGAHACIASHRCDRDLSWKPWVVLLQFRR